MSTLYRLSAALFILCVLFIPIANASSNPALEEIEEAVGIEKVSNSNNCSWPVFVRCSKYGYYNKCSAYLSCSFDFNRAKKNTNVVHARCRKGNGEYNSTSINCQANWRTADLANCDGNLKWGGC